MSNAACNARDVLFTRNLGKCNQEPRPAPASRSYLHGISGRYAADAEIRGLVAHSLGSGGDICRYGGRLGRYCLRSVCHSARHVFRTLCPCVRDAVDVGLFATQSAFSNRCTRDGGRHGFGGFARCVGSGCSWVPVAIEMLQCFRNFCAGRRSCDDRNHRNSA